VELEDPAFVLVVSVSPASVVFAWLSVAPNSIWPIHDPATPAARPANRGLRCINEDCMAGAGWAIGAWLPDAVGGAAADGLGVVDCSMGFAPFWSKVRDPRLPMLPGELLLREPLEYPPPYPPPLALAKDRVGSPIRETTIIAAMSFVVFKASFLSIDVAGQSTTRHHPNRMAPRKPK